MGNSVNKDKPWKNRWTHVRDLPGGGQGATFVVRARDGTLGVLKLLHRPDALERRARMYREVAALDTLQHRQIPRVLDHNTCDYRSSTRLYIVTEFIDGATLSQAVEQGCADVRDALAMATSFCDTLTYAHSRGILHRDIKPDNVILRAGRFDDPVLIDFGLSFNTDDATEEPLTVEGQHLGNRFIVLPELMRGGAIKRDARSDVTQVVALLFFAITGEMPTVLQDEEGRFPHQRPNAVVRIEKLAAVQQDHLRRIFDKGFHGRIEQRWQSAKDLLDALVLRSAKKSDDSKTPIELRIAARLGERGDYRDRATFESAKDAIVLAIHSAANDAGSKVDRHFRGGPKHVSTDWSTQTFRYRRGITHELVPEIAFVADFVGRVVGNEIVVSVEVDGVEEQVGRVPFVKDPRVSSLQSTLVSFFSRHILEQLESA